MLFFLATCTLIYSRASSDEKEIHFEPGILKQFAIHVTVYADILLGWQLYSQRAALLKSVAPDIQKLAPAHIIAGLRDNGLGTLKTSTIILSII